MMLLAGANNALATPDAVRQSYVLTIDCGGGFIVSQFVKLQNPRVFCYPETCSMRILGEAGKS